MIKNRFVLIDAYALIFRAYYALPPTMTYSGKPINAAYGFTSALLSAIKTLEPEFLAVGMDKGKSLRTADFTEYKAHRAPVPDDLMSQVPYVREVLKVMNIPCFAVEGFEGEDVIATIIEHTKKNRKDIEFIVVTGDMDCLQLIDEQTKVYSMARGVNLAQMYDIEKVKERYGLLPSQFVDFKALKGDPSDNIPGVPGIGEKTAAKLVAEYKSIEKIYENIDKISEKVATLLKENKEQAFLSYKLSKIDDNAPIEFELLKAKVNHYNKESTIKLFKEYNFRSLIARLPEEEKQEQPKLF